MELLLTLVLAGLISCAHATKSCCCDKKVKKDQCYSPLPSKTLKIVFSDGYVFDEKNQFSVTSFTRFNEQPASISFDCEPGKVYTYIKACNYSFTTNGNFLTQDAIYSNIRLIKDCNVFSGERHIDNAPLIDNYTPVCCVYIIAEQTCSLTTPGSTGHPAEVRYTTDILNGDCAIVKAAFAITVVKDPCGCNPPSDPNEPTCPAQKPVLPIKICLSGCGCG